jgi:hypothetical protein
MPYIDAAARKFLDPHIDSLAAYLVSGTVGDLNYVLTRLAMKFLLHKGIKYSNINSVAGVLQKVLAEFDSRVTVPYEKQKRIENGDIPEYTQFEESGVL